MKLHAIIAGCLVSAGLILVTPAAVRGIDLSTTEITSIEGRVEVKKGADAAFKKLHSNLKLSGAMKRLDGGDKVRTYAQSSAEMALKETCILAVKEQSIFEVPRTLGSETIAELKAQQGALLFKVISGSNFQVQTADVIAGVKGTLFELDIIDNFDCLLETPGLQIGTLAAGGTMVNVYKGEVELTHAQTGKKRTLKEGQGLAALGSRLLNLDKILQDGFTPLRQFDPATLLGEKFGDGALGLLQTSPTISGLTEFAGLGDVPVDLGENRFSELLIGLSNPLTEKLQAVEQYTRSAGEVIESAKELEKLGKDLLGEQYQVDFSEYEKIESPFTLTGSRFSEVYLGGQTFAACRTFADSKRTRLEPNKEGLILNEGSGAFKVRKYRNTNPTVEFYATFQQQGNNLITTVKSVKGELYGRIPGEIEHFKIPTDAMSFVLDTSTGKSSRQKADKTAMPDELTRYSLKIDEKISREKAAHDAQAKEKQIDAVKKVIKNPKDLIRKFKF